MSRTISRAFVTAAWSKNRVEAEDQARKYCRELVKLGYMPLCPILIFSGVISEDDPDGEKKYREMSLDLLKRARVFVTCGDVITEDMEEEESIAYAHNLVVTDFEGMMKRRKSK